jgi:hypothetical protein
VDIEGMEDDNSVVANNGTTTTIKTMRMAMTMVMIRVIKISTVERSIICTLILLQMVSSVIY